MATPDYERIAAKVADLISGITTAGGYVNNLTASNVLRKLISLDDAIAIGTFPVICSVRRPGASGAREVGSIGNYKSRLPLLFAAYLRIDQTSGKLAETELNLLQNDIQKRLVDEAALRSVGAIDIHFPEEPITAEDPAQDGVIYAAMWMAAEVTYFLPRKGY